MKQIQIYFLLSIVIIFDASLFSQNTKSLKSIDSTPVIEDLFNNHLSKDQLTELKKGKEVMTRLQSANNLCLNPINNEAKKNIELVQTLSPSYLMEIIKILPQAGHEDLSQQLNNTLLNIEKYNEIPYFSESHQRWKNFLQKHIF